VKVGYRQKMDGQKSTAALSPRHLVERARIAISEYRLTPGLTTKLTATFCDEV
jgi:hypothetical protein